MVITKPIRKRKQYQTPPAWELRVDDDGQEHGFVFGTPVPGPRGPGLGAGNLGRGPGLKFKSSGSGTESFKIRDSGLRPEPYPGSVPGSSSFKSLNFRVKFEELIFAGQFRGENIFRDPVPCRALVWSLTRKQANRRATFLPYQYSPFLVFL